MDVTNRRHGRQTTQTKPKVIANYNSHMDGIDHFDMMLCTYLDENSQVCNKGGATFFAK